MTTKIAVVMSIDLAASAGSAFRDVAGWIEAHIRLHQDMDQETRDFWKRRHDSMIANAVEFDDAYMSAKVVE